ncbi:hypothetical protein PTKIN_Ptkin10aG0140800 [Pterospermum kingtungense]
MEYAAGGELFERICNAGRFSEDEARYFLRQLISGVSDCHHADMPSRFVENTLLDGSPAPRLKICEFGYSKLKLGIDSKLVVEWLNAEHEKCVRFQNLLSAIRELLARNWEVQVFHIYRECNRVADLLASRAVLHERGLHIVDIPSGTIQDALWDDVIGVAWSRRIPVRVT